VAEAGVLLARVTQLKGKGERRYVGVATGMNSLLRPALYGSRHEIVNLSRPDAPPAVRCTVVGPICESGDVLGEDRLLPACEEGDVLLFATAGAYGHAMGSHYNLRPPAEELLL
jgi:diaminopimelate decarboxylase/aspartate kinase